jgi:PAS domain S-box-containing protein
MSTHEVVYHALLAVGGLLCVGVASYAWRRRERSGAKLLVGLFVAVVYWIVTTSLVLVFAGTPLGRAVARAQYVGVTLSTMFVVLLALQYTGREKYVTRSTVALLAIHPLLTNVAVWIPPFREHFLTFGAADPGTFYGYAYEFGGLFLVHTLYSYILLVAAAVMYVSFAVRSDDIYQRQTVALIVGLLAPWFGNAIYLLGPISVDITSLTFAITGLALWWAIFYQDFLEVVPVARGTIVDNLNAGVVVLDRNDRVVDINPRGRKLLDLDDAAIGRPVADALASHTAIHDAYATLTSHEDSDETEVAVEGRDFRIEVSPLYNRRDERIGNLLVVEDISERKRRQRELQRQNEQLEQFANVVSHDLRNPLNVASSRLELGIETGDEEHLRRVEQAHQRMDRIIDDVLTLAREGKQVEARSRESLRSLAERAWRHVETPAAELVVADDREIEADEQRLVRALENLFRNALEHGREDATVTVGSTQAGFYVADDGQGIATDHQDEVFEDGYTTNDDGTGFGLAIVQSIVEAHGWEITVRDSEDGGARFDVRGITPPTGREDGVTQSPPTDLSG